MKHNPLEMFNILLHQMNGATCTHYAPYTNKNREPGERVWKMAFGRLAFIV